MTNIYFFAQKFKDERNMSLVGQMAARRRRPMSEEKGKIKNYAFFPLSSFFGEIWGEMIATSYLVEHLKSGSLVGYA